MRFLPLAAALLTPLLFAEALTIDSDFEGASVKVLQTDDATQTVRFTPGGDATRGWPCWWYFRVTGLDPAKPLHLEIHPSTAVIPQKGPYQNHPLSADWSQPVRAAYSLDAKEWKQSEPGHRDKGAMSYSISCGASSVLVAWGPAYTPSKAAAFVREVASRSAWAQALELCHSRENHPVPMLHISEGDKVEARRFGIWVEARQHAWESGGSWVCQGFTEWLTGSDLDAQWLRQNAEITIVPIMDIDHTTTGDGGKEAIPQDHNRDWSDAPHWPEVVAAQQHLAQLGKEGRLDLFIDLHNPAPNDKEAYFFAPPSEILRGNMAANIEAFVALADREITPAMPMLHKPKISGPLYHPLWRQISGNWVSVHGGDQTVALCLETPWNTPHSTAEGYKAVGAALAKAAQKYFEARSK